ncbi:MAG: PEGA domain-containing protein [Myxococcota bacterium]
MYKFMLASLILLLQTLPVSANKKVSIPGFEADPSLIKKAKFCTNSFKGFAKSLKMTLVPSSEIEEMKMLYCDTEKDTKEECQKKMAKEVKSDVFITGRVSKQGSKMKISINFTENNSSKYFYKVVSLKASKSKIKSRLKNIWNSYFKQPDGKVVIDINQAGASVFVDGQLIFKTVPGDNLIPKIKPGSHTLKIVSKNGKTWEKSIKVKSNQTNRFNVKFPGKTDKIPAQTKDTTKEKDQVDLTEPGKKTKTEDSPTNYWKYAFWGSTGVTAALFIAGTYTGLQVRKYEQDKEDLLTDPTNPAHTGSDVCTGAEGELKTVCDNGQSMATMTNVLFVSGAVVGIASAYFLYKGYLSSETEINSSIEEQDSSTLTIMPVISPSGGGLSISTTF